MVRRAHGTGDVAVYEIASRERTAVLNPASRNARVTELQKRQLRKRNLHDSDVDILQDLDFPTVCSRAKQTRDGQFMGCVGTYPPQIRVYDFAQLCVKFQRNVDAEVVDFQFLTEDWRKLAVLCVDRTLEFHAQFGTYYKLRIPKFGRDLAFHRGQADLFVCGAGPEVWRLNLEHGRFFAPWSSQSGMHSGNNVIGLHPSNGLLALGGDSGLLEIWDPRSSSLKAAGLLDVQAALLESDASLRFEMSELLGKQRELSGHFAGVTALRFSEAEAATMAVGTRSGHSMLFDLRSPRALTVKEQGFDSPIRTLRFLNRERVLSADVKSIKVWDPKRPDENVLALEPAFDVNQVCVIRNSGVMFVAVESPKVQAYYVPVLGLAPAWCSFLDTFTEELENNTAVNAGSGRTGASASASSVYENFKFVSRDELAQLGAENLIGSTMLKPHMHGFFMNMRLYRKLLDVSQPFAYEQYRKQRIQEKLAQQQESRIAKVGRRQLLSGTPAAHETARANIELYKKKLHDAKADAKSKKAGRAETMLQDERFAALFANKDFEMSVDDPRYKHLNPSAASASQAKHADRRRALEDEDSGVDGGNSDTDDEPGSDQHGFEGEDGTGSLDSSSSDGLVAPLSDSDSDHQLRSRKANEQAVRATRAEGAPQQKSLRLYEEENVSAIPLFGESQAHRSAEPRSGNLKRNQRQAKMAHMSLGERVQHSARKGVGRRRSTG
ncbi:Nucleolar protein 10 [Porphyridium purpureum]|uniref:Nucleolar protein 10 n=1 Tax=Porphyridium purpureum TaxID=35688 RepID=A0A5J4Z009_PORPP|nr:Nucleolar protein 10 [Porphyridium purpureum]|eukprot:POR6723..scf209_3